MKKVGVISLFPEMFKALSCGVSGRALKQQLLDLKVWNPRDFSQSKHRTVDDRPYGGGPGMVMMVQPLQDAIHAAKTEMGSKPHVICLSPQGKPLTQQAIGDLAQHEALILLCGRYEGIDERLVDLEIDAECSIGDYVLSGGELAAMVLIDGLIRLIPGALGDENSAQQDSFMQGLLDCPHYTRPEQVAGLTVPAVLLSGDHSAIERWRLKQALGRTWLRRPDLLKQRSLNDVEQALLNEFINEYEN